MNYRRSKRGTTVSIALAMGLVFFLALGAGLYFRVVAPSLRARTTNPAFQFPSPLDLAALPTAARFDFPIGSENGALTYNAQPFTQNRHLGDDLNGIGGENSDLNDPVFAVADGHVIFAHEAGTGWGNVVIVLHAYDDHGARKFVQSYYAHLETMFVSSGDKIRRGQQIATIGNAHGQYWAHLHFEMHEFITPFIGPGYRDDTRGWLNPTEFIQAHRGASADDVGRSKGAQQVNPVHEDGGDN